MAVDVMPTAFSALMSSLDLLDLRVTVSFAERKSFPAVDSLSGHGFLLVVGVEE